MSAAGVNTVRTYTVPPRWLLDCAERHDLSIMVGLPWEQHVTFLEDRARMRSIEERVREGVAACAGHRAVLGYAVGNEIPASIVRWHGRRPIERFLKRLYAAAKEEDPDGLVTYVNFPSTEYLELPFLDFVTFNVYLEAERTLDAYLARLQNIAGDRPLVMAEIGLDSRRNGEDVQATVLGWQVRTAYGAGCAGAYVFAWTDEWHRGGFDIDDWDFGLTDRDREPKPALTAVQEAFADAPGGPIHVLLSDREAEHIPGCNSAFRRATLLEIGGWDPRFRTAGDDVDICWRLQQRGWTLGFSPAAVVWHHRRNSIRTFWHQQKGYGRAEALLEAKWPEKYNPAGHLSWAGRMYGRGLILSLYARQRVYHGSWGMGLFQQLYRPSPGTLASLPLMPEWYLLIALLATVSALGVLWTPLLVAVPLLVAAVVAVLAQAVKSATRAIFPT